jgi:single-strand DNA-binding protein
MQIARAILTGNLTRDAELRHGQTGTPVLNFSVAVNQREKQGENWVDRASFFDCVMFGNRAEAIAGYLLKGTSVAVDARLWQDRWEKDGRKGSKVMFRVDEVQWFSAVLSQKLDQILRQQTLTDGDRRQSRERLLQPGRRHPVLAAR